MRVAVVGHVEWVTFARVDHVPLAGEIANDRGWWESAAGGGPVAAVQLAKLAGGCTLFTALGEDETGARARAELEALGLRRGGRPRRAHAEGLHVHRRERRAHDHHARPAA